MNRTFFSIILLVLSVLSCDAQSQSPREDLAHALSMLDSAIDSIELGSEHHENNLSVAAALLQSTIDQHDFQTPGLYHALGNAFVLNADLGHGIIAYRRGEQLDPTDFQLQASLKHARELVQVRVAPNTNNRLWDMIILWRSRLSQSWLLAIFSLASLSGWILLSIGILRRSINRLLIPAALLIMVSACSLLFLGADWVETQRSAQGVVVISEAEARTGPDDLIYDLAFDIGLSPGVEGNVEETRDGWYRLRLADGSTCWIHSSSIEFVNR